MAFPTLLLRLASVTRSGNVPLGEFDLIRPALDAVADGSLPEWGRRIPAGYELCRRVTPEVRDCAWDGSLVADEPDGWIAGFLDIVAGRDPLELARDLDELEAAMEILDSAETVFARVMRARLGPVDLPSVHPLSESGDPPDDVPFGFALGYARFKGIAPMSYADFSLASGATDAESFLSTIVSNPDRWFRNIGGLDRILSDFARHRDRERYRDDVAEWNEMQDLALPRPDPSVVVPADGRIDIAEVLDWCADIEASARGLVSGILRTKWSWFPTTS